MLTDLVIEIAITIMLGLVTFILGVESKYPKSLLYLVISMVSFILAAVLCLSNSLLSPTDYFGGVVCDFLLFVAIIILILIVGSIRDATKFAMAQRYEVK